MPMGINVPGVSREDLRHYYMPPEWAPHQGTILTWPHRPDIWRGVHAEVEEMFFRLVQELREVGFVHINVPNRDYMARLRNKTGNERIQYHVINSDDVWARDHGPIFIVRRPGAPDHLPPMVMLDWKFNAWGGKFESKLDNLIPREMNDYFCLPRIEPGLVMEGGSLEVNGEGDLITTESVLLTDTRNPGKSREEIEASLRLHLGVERTHWLGSGLEGDDTDGHVDDMARFVDSNTIVLVMPVKDHPDRQVMFENLERLQDARNAHGGRFEIVCLPMPEPISFLDEHLPASYANYYVTNGKVLVPTFGQPSDAQALGTLQELMPKHRVIGIDGRALVTQYGNIHCVTQQIPATNLNNPPLPR